MTVLPNELASPARDLVVHPEHRAGRRERRRLGQAVQLLRRPWILAALAMLVVVAVIASTFSGGTQAASEPLVYYTVTRGDLPITVVERGNLESQSNVKVLCEVDDLPGDGAEGTAILSIIPNGTSVTEGALLVELDASKHRERLDQQIIETEQAKSLHIQANAKYENQITQNETAKAEAELKVALAEIELEMFDDQQKGSHKLAVEEIKRGIDDLNLEIQAAQASLTIKHNDFDGIEELFQLGYAGKSERDRSRVEFLQAESQYAAKINRLTTQLATLEKKEDYEYRMEKLKLEGALATAQRALKQVDRDNEAKLAQAKAALDAAEASLKKEEERLARYREQVEKCKIYAPQDGMVAYAVNERYSSWMAEVREGSPMRPRQHILSLPDLKRMQVETSIHESVLDQVHADLAAVVRVDAFPDRTYRGKVIEVAVLPDQGGWMSSDTKVYKTVVVIEEEVQRLKPGMTAVVEIQVDQLHDVVSIPVQAAMQVGRETWCYVENGSGAERRDLLLGRTNDKFVEVREGLKEGDRVVLNPMALWTETQQPGVPGVPEEGAPSQNGDAPAKPAAEAAAVSARPAPAPPSQS